MGVLATWEMVDNEQRGGLGTWSRRSSHPAMGRQVPVRDLVVLDCRLSVLPQQETPCREVDEKPQPSVNDSRSLETSNCDAAWCR